MISDVAASISRSSVVRSVKPGKTCFACRRSSAETVQTREKRGSVQPKSWRSNQRLRQCRGDGRCALLACVPARMSSTCSARSTLRVRGGSGRQRWLWVHVYFI